MKTDLHTIKDMFKISFDSYEDSIAEANEVDDMYHNRQYNQSQLNTLANRGQPAETFNIIKLFGRMLLGYYSTVVNTVRVSPRKKRDILTSSLLNDIVDYTMENNHFETEGDKIKLDGLNAGLMCVYVDVVDTDQKDEFGRTIRRIELHHVPWQQVALDPLSTQEDYSDARFIHRWKWVAEEKLLEMFPDKKEQIKLLWEYQNHLLVPDAEFTETFNTQFQGWFKRYKNYCLVNTVIEDDDKKVWSIYWCGEQELSREEVTFKGVRFPYRVHKLQTSHKAEFYGIFREVVESQKAINQALLKIQLMANTQKAFVEDGGVENIDEFTNQFNRVNAVIKVKSLAKIKIDNLSKEVLDQYTIIDKALSRIQKVLGVNDSFMGLAYASDSGRKVKLQQNATEIALRYITARIEQFYRLLGWDIVNLVKQYYTAHEALRITDETVGDRWIEINQPMQMWTRRFDANNQPIMEYVWDEVLDPATGKPQKDEKGNLIIAPVPSRETDIAFTDCDISIDSVVYNDEDEKNQIMMETILQGNIGSALLQVNPAGFFKMTSLSIRSMKMKYSLDIGDILDQTAQMVMKQQAQPQPDTQPDQAQVGTPPGQPQGAVPQMSRRTSKKSQTLKLPQNTNEGYP